MLSRSDKMVASSLCFGPVLPNPHRLKACATFVLVNNAFFHYEEHLLRHTNVLYRISWHRDYIRDLARLERTQASGHAEQFGINGSPRLQRLKRVHPQI